MCWAGNWSWPFISGCWTTPATAAARATLSIRTCCISTAAWCGPRRRWKACWANRPYANWRRKSWETFPKCSADYLGNARVIAAADEFEQACQLFTRLRTAMRLSASGESPLHDPYLLEAEESKVVQQSLEDLA